MFKPLDYQIEMAKQGYAVLKQYGIVYLAGEERVRKTLPAIMITNMCSNVKHVLVITMKEPIKGWKHHLSNYNTNAIFTVCNFHSAHKFLDLEPDLVIIDEAHNCIGGFPKKSQINKRISTITKGLPLIYISATPHAQGYSSLYHQFSLSSWSPWKRYKNFLAWFKDYGIPETVYVQSVARPVYTNTIESMVKADTDHLFITKKRQDVGFEHEPEDKVHHVELNDSTLMLYNTLIKKRLYTFKNGLELVCDTASKLRFALHMIEGGTFIIRSIELNKNCKPKDVRHYYQLPNTEKIDYIKQKWGDTKDLVIFYYYKEEKRKLEKHFKNAKILQSTTHAEGIDLWEYETVVVYSQDWRTAKYTQRRARQTSLNRTTPIIVHYLLVKGAVSDQCYQTVAINKQNFVDSRFTEEEI
ncbi:hypothetical protein CL622_06415 [archaeon]|nr:hypothetical protein [archaeon]|tara:strand:- start:1636 stop:2874 length:1239 start_codon:yes stop_codon:yes gene_type:complete